MPIPPLESTGFLPPGIHDCTLEEVEKRFGGFQSSDRRPQLWKKFKEFLREAKAAGLVEALLLDGSFATAKAEPNDIDFVLLVSTTHDFTADLTPAEYAVLSRRRIHRRYGFDVLVARTGSEQHRRYLSFFQQIRFEPGHSKGILRIRSI